MGTNELAHNCDHTGRNSDYGDGNFKCIFVCLSVSLCSIYMCVAAGKSVNNKVDLHAHLLFPLSLSDGFVLDGGLTTTLRIRRGNI